MPSKAKHIPKAPRVTEEKQSRVAKRPDCDGEVDENIDTSRTQSEDGQIDTNQVGQSSNDALALVP